MKIGHHKKVFKAEVLSISPLSQWFPLTKKKTLETSVLETFYVAHTEFSTKLTEPNHLLTL